MFFYCELISGDFSSITGDDAHHLSRVLHLQKGEPVKLFDGKGTIASGIIFEISKTLVNVKINNIQTHKTKQEGRIIIAASIAKGERFDWMVGKCTEMGVDVIWPVLFERTVKQGSGHSVERYNKIAFAAAKQCERPFLPVIKQPTTLEACVDEIKAEFADIRLLFGSMDETAISIFENIDPAKDYAAFVGPEGGMTSKEEESLEASGAVGVKLTQTILRTETAAEAFAAILCSQVNRRD